MTFSREARTGMLSALLILAMGWGMTVLTSVRQQKEWGDAYHIIFNRVEGIEEGSKVYYQGRLIGRVRSLEIRPTDHRVDVTIATLPRLFAEHVELTRESHYRIEGRMFGRRWIVISYEPGEVVPPNGEVAGESARRFDQMTQAGLGGVANLQKQVATFKAMGGHPAEFRRRVLAAMKLYNDLTFDMRAQVNNLNKFSGIADEQLDGVADKVEASTLRAQERSRVLVRTLRVYVAELRGRIEAGDELAQAQVRLLESKLELARSFVADVQATLDEERRLLERLAYLRKKAAEYHELAQTIRLVSSHPELVPQLQGGLHGVRERIQQVRRDLERAGAGLPREVSAGSGGQGGPGAGTGAAPASAPAPATPVPLGIPQPR